MTDRRKRAAQAALAGPIAFAAALMAGLAAAPAQDMDPEARAQLRSEIRSYLLEHPEVVMEALRTLEEKRRVAEAQAATDTVRSNADAIFDDGYSYVAGDPDGDITVVEFLDYNCGYCKRAHADVKKLIESDGDIRFVIKEFPILGPTSRTAAEAAMAAMEQDGGERYLAFSDALMSHRGTLEEETIYRIAAQVGLDPDKLREGAKDAKIGERISANYDIARKLEIQGTPTFIIGDTVVRGFVPLEKLRAEVEAQREKAGKEG